MTDMDRTEELRRNLTKVRTRIEDAAARRTGPVPELIVVTKFFPAADVAALAALGVADVGENRDQEASQKAAELADTAAGESLRWHFIGQLQKNKAKSVVRYAHAVHSVDRSSLIGALDKAMAVEQERRSAANQPPRPELLCLIQVDLDERTEVPGTGEAAGPRGGAQPEQIEELARAIDAANGLRLGGLMAVAPLGTDPVPAFGRLMDYSASLREIFPDAWMVSAGMSQDLEAAIAAGATHLRVGSDVLGPRPALR